MIAFIALSSSGPSASMAPVAPLAAASRAFASADLDTGLIERSRAELHHVYLEGATSLRDDLPE
mgnify:CR=1 FL=1